MNAIPDRGLERLSQADALVIKIGGENALEFQSNYEQITAQEKKQFVTISALRNKDFNTTSKLIEVARLANNSNPSALNILEEIKQFHLQVIQEKVEAEYQAGMVACIEEAFTEFEGTLTELIETQGKVHKLGEDYLFTDSNGAHHSLTGFGEKIVERLYQTYFELKGTTTNSLNDQEWMQPILGEEPSEALRLQRSMLQRLRRQFKSEVKRVLDSENKVTITGGYKPGMAFRRSYTDLTAAEIARASSSLGVKTVLGVEKKDPILTADPRRIADRTKIQIVRRLGWKLASELFGIKGAQAGAVHPDVMDTLEGSGVDIVVYDPKNLAQGSTWISEDPEAYEDRKTIIATRNIPTTVVVRGSMGNATQVLARITNAFRHFVQDQTYSSQNVWAVTINESVPPELIDRLTRQLKRQYGKSFEVHVHEDLALVLAIGKSERNGYKDALNNQGIQTPFTNSVDEAESSGYVIPRDLVDLAVNTMHDQAYAA